MTSTWKQKANARNARFSTGPTSEEGKAASSRNSLKHGYTAHKLATPTDDPAFARERANWIAVFSPANLGALQVVDEAFLNMRRVKHMHEAEESRTRRRVLDATDNFDLERRREIGEALEKLLDDPFPSYLKLTSTVLGCERLLGLLDEIEDRLDGGTWDDRCLDLLKATRGRGKESRDLLLRIASDYVIGNQRPETAQEQAQRLRRRLAEQLAALRNEAIEPDETDDDEEGGDLLAESRAAIRRGIAAEREELNLVVEELADEDEISRRLAVKIAMVDLSPEGQLFQRYITQATNAFNRSFAQARDSAGVDLSRVDGPLPDRTASSAPSLPPEPTRTPTPVPPPPSAPASPRADSPKREARAGLRNEPKARSEDRADRSDSPADSADLDVRFRKFVESARESLPPGFADRVV